jgi:hypothetical protein
MSGTVTRPRGLLADRDFRLWFLARAVSEAGTAASSVALPLLVYRTSGSAALTASVVGLEALPYLIFGLIAGAVADRVSRTNVMVGAYLWCAVLLATPLVLRALGVLPAWYVLVVAFGVGAGYCWFNAAGWGAQATLASKARLAEANSMVWGAELVLDITVPAGAGVLAAVTDPTVVIVLDAASYLVAAAMIARLRGRLDKSVEARPVTQPLLAGIGEGIRYLWHQPVVRALSVAGFWLSCSFGGALGLVVVHADRLLHIGATDPRIGLLFTARAIGSLIAVWALPRISRWLGQGPASIYAYSVYVLAAGTLALSRTFAVALVLWGVFELARVTATMNGITVRQQLTPGELQGRVNTTGRMVAWGGTPVGAVIGGSAAQTAGVPVAFAVLALTASVGLALLLASPVRRLRHAAAD